jgi:ribosome-associated protein
VAATAADSRSQARNRDLALDRLRSKLADALRIERPRHPTRPGASAREERLEAKHRRAVRKRDRRPPRADEE